VDYPFGPGDTIEVSVAALAEITNKVVRVSRAGTITLPLIGKIHAGGLTEEGLSEEIRRRLAAEYMHDPQVNLLVREYRSRQVAVVGAVEKPGLYSLGSDTDTLLDMISLAGGSELPSVACAAACAVVESIDDALLADVLDRGEQLVDGLSSLPGVEYVRGRGLMVAAVLDRDVAPVVDACREEGLLVLTAGAPPVLRLLPPLVVSEAEVEQALAILADVLR